MADIMIKLKKEYAVVTQVPETTDTDGKAIPATESINWTPALKMAAMEIQGLNAYAQEGSPFPAPIKCNPEATIPEGFIGDNTPPNEEGIVRCRIVEYTYINLAFLPAIPKTFDLLLGVPDETGQFAR